MIGLKIQNLCWERALLCLLGERAEVWQAGHHYALVLTDLSKGALKKFEMQEKTQLIGLGKTDLSICLPLPIKSEDLEKILMLQTFSYENKFFIWDGIFHRLIYKKTKKIFLLTEKENTLLGYLVAQPSHYATKEILLENVWQYTSEVETHTAETTLYALRQKLGSTANRLITSDNKGYRLV